MMHIPQGFFARADFIEIMLIRAIGASTTFILLTSIKGINFLKIKPCDSIYL
jgi:hypothetical protein